MQIGLAAWGLREEPLEAQLRLTRDLGLDLLEFSIANHPNDALQLSSTDAEIENVRALFKRHGVRLDCGCTGNDLTGDDVDAQKQKVAAVIAIAAKLGIKFLRVFAGFNSDSQVHGERLARMLTALKELNELAAGKGMTLCVETHGGVTALENGALLHFHSVSTRADQWKKILGTGVSICYDPANLSAVGAAAPEAFYQCFKGHIPYVHLKDFKDVPGGIVPAACGEGRLDWESLMAAMKGYAGPAMIEYELPGDVKDGMARSLAYLRKGLWKKKALVRVDQQPKWNWFCPEWRIEPAPPPRDQIEIRVAGNPILKCGEIAEFQIRFLSNGIPMAGKKMKCTLHRDFHDVETLELVSGMEPAVVRTSLEKPGFACINVTSDGCSGAFGAGFEPMAITAAPEVEGFSSFWEAQKKRLAAVPMRERYCDEVPLADASYVGVRCYDVAVDCAGDAPVSGMLAMPDGAAPKSLPAYVFFHGAGVRPAFQPLPWAVRGMLAFNVNAHGLPNRADEDFYRKVANEALKNYAERHYQKPEDSLFADMVLRVLRALEYLKSRPEWDGKTLIVHGGSQGGFQALAAAGLDMDVTFAVFNAPAMCNLAGAVEGRVPNWPKTVLPGGDPEEIRASLFCDSASFARHAVAEAVFTDGFADLAATPSSIYAAYNVYNGPKRILDFPDKGHETSVFWTGETEIIEHIAKQKKQS